VPLLEDVETVSLIADEELSSARTTSFSAVSGTIGELESTYSVNKRKPGWREIEDHVTDSQGQRPKKIKGGKSGRRGWGSPDL
jgi:hypothetical protein